MKVAMIGKWRVVLFTENPHRVILRRDWREIPRAGDVVIVGNAQYEVLRVNWIDGATPRWELAVDRTIGHARAPLNTPKAEGWS